MLRLPVRDASPIWKYLRVRNACEPTVDAQGINFSRDTYERVGVLSNLMTGFGVTRCSGMIDLIMNADSL